MKLNTALIIFSTVVLYAFSLLVYSDELKLRSKMAHDVNRMFFLKQFRELDDMAARFRATGERSPSGVWKLTIFYGGFSHVGETVIKEEDYWDEIKSIVDKWIEINPNSPTARIAKGIIMERYAWKIRGPMYAYKVPKERWKPFRDSVKAAYDYLMSNKHLAELDPHWYVVTAKVFSYKGVDNNRLMKHINEGLSRYPYYYQLYFSAIDYLVPKWHGDKVQIEDFANNAVDLTKQSEGMGMYARIYWYVSSKQYGKKLFTDSNVEWEKMREGIFDVLDKYPDQWNIQNFGRFACLAKDKKTARKILKNVKGKHLIGTTKVGKKKISRLYNCLEFAGLVDEIDGN